MKTATRERAKILAEIENIPFAVQGKICENRKPLANGGIGVYHNLQWWADGKNHAIHIPEERLEEFKKAVEGGKRVRELVYELSEASSQALLAAEPSTAKKNPRDMLLWRRGARGDSAGRIRLDRQGRDRLHGTSRAGAGQGLQGRLPQAA